ncbi:MAG: hypothetical protein AW07_03920 [Candidatus Accumulibacter sp. SK-11]|nr:MAG: hypothetical protein AW07_03920 [Candidatus Accumulibacter sp. SK-11]
MARASASTVRLCCSAQSRRRSYSARARLKPRSNQAVRRLPRPSLVSWRM